jgi:urease accessory protein
MQTKLVDGPAPRARDLAVRRVAAACAPIALLLSPGAALAHPAGPLSSFGQGLVHPLHGPDHLLAMVAVGLLAARRTGTGRLALPAAFVAAAAAGWLLVPALAWGPPPELVIAASVVALGAMLAFGASGRAAVVAVLLFGGLHGFVHAIEVVAASRVAAATGFLTATAALHAAGLAVGTLLLGRGRVTALRTAGAAVALAGLAIATM